MQRSDPRHIGFCVDKMYAEMMAHRALRFREAGAFQQPGGDGAGGVIRHPENRVVAFSKIPHIGLNGHWGLEPCTAGSNRSAVIDLELVTNDGLILLLVAGPDLVVAGHCASQFRFCCLDETLRRRSSWSNLPRRVSTMSSMDLSISAKLEYPKLDSWKVGSIRCM